MTNFDKLKTLTLEEAAVWLDKLDDLESAPWMKWFSNTYCDNCEVIHYQPKDSIYPLCQEYSFCEKNGKCRYFPKHKSTLDCVDIIKLWLNTEQDIDKEIE